MSSPVSAPARVHPSPTDTFSALGLPAPLLRAAGDLGFAVPTAIQAQAIPALLAGRDITGVAQTGTGKTAAFGLPLLAAVDGGVRGVQGLVLAPTRELAMQVADALTAFAAHLPGVEVVAVYGGAPYQPQQRALARGAQVVVGTPGRVIDFIERGTLVLDGVRMCVLDEADEMLRMGFAEDVETILGAVPAERQVALFSATMPPPIRRVAARHLNDPVEIAVSRQSSTVASVRQTYAVVPHRHKTGALARVLAVSDADAAIVFTRTRAAAEQVGSALVEAGLRAATISGDVQQKERERIVDRLRTGALDVLVATDVAARGLDVERVGLVVNFDVPGEPEAYVHRIGRTGRAGRTGEALTFVTPGERGRLRGISRATRVELEEVSVPSPADVSAHRARTLLGKVAGRVEAGRLSMYTDLVREWGGAESGVGGDEAGRDDLVELAAALLALAVGDDGPRLREEQERFEAEQAEADRLRERADARSRDERHSGGGDGRRGAGEHRHAGGHHGPSGPAARDDGQRGIRREPVGTRYRLAVGHTHGAQPNGIVGALTGEGGLSGKDLGKIDIFATFSLVDIRTPLDAEAVHRISKARVGGRQLRIAVDRGAPTRSHDSRRPGPRR